MRLVSCPLASDLDLDVLLGNQDGYIKNVLEEHNARTAAMHSHGELMTMKMRGEVKTEVRSMTADKTFVSRFPPPPPLMYL